ncbi:MAG: M48 family metalloprotease, partial [Elusimicrobia bacterium]|nr:M48 family metalloprotease [Elusimicrobiota bacterium]
TNALGAAESSGSAAPLRGSIRASTVGAVGSAAAAALVAAGSAVIALWALAPAAAVAAAGAGLAAGYRVVAAPIPVSSRELYHAPRAIEAVPVEFRPVVETLARLAEKLGAPVPRAALYKPEDPGLAHGGWNAQALGPRLSEESAVAVGESWVNAPSAELEGALAHELGHLHYGDNRRVEAFRRTANVALWTLPLSIGAALLTGAWFAPAIAAGLWIVSLVSGASMHRLIEHRADLFASWLAGPEKTRAFLERMVSVAPDSGGGPLATHPSPSRRLASL